MLVALVGFTAVAYRVGRFASTRLGWTTGPYAAAIVGILIMLTPLIVTRLAGFGGGFLFPGTLLLGAVATLVEYVAWTVGFGAVALVRFASRTRSA